MPTITREQFTRSVERWFESRRYDRLPSRLDLQAILVRAAHWPHTPVADAILTARYLHV